MIRLVSEHVNSPPNIGTDDPTKYLVWNDVYATDPAHDMLAKDDYWSPPPIFKINEIVYI